MAEIGRQLGQDYVAFQRQRVRGRLAGGCRPLSVTVCIQGGGMKGAWQGGLLEALFGQTSSLKLKACFGSSAGALNAVLLSRKIADRSQNVFRGAWCGNVHLFPVAVLMLLLALPVSLIVAACLVNWIVGIVAASTAIIYVLGWAFLLLRRRALPRGLTRLNGVIPHWIFRWAVSKIIGKQETISVFTRAYASCIDQDSRGLFDSQHPHTFEFAPGSSTSPVNSPGVHIDGCVSVLEAVAASCCLPGVETAVFDGHKFADGGMYSNLPANALVEFGLFGADMAFLVLPTRVNQLNPKGSNVDHRVLCLLHQLKALQQEGRTRMEAVQGTFQATSVPASAMYPVVIIEPCETLRCDTVTGVLSSRMRTQDYESGQSLGLQLLGEMSAWLKQTSTFFEQRWLLNVSLPDLPPDFKRVEEEWWARLANARWRDDP